MYPCMHTYFRFFLPLCKLVFHDGGIMHMSINYHDEIRWTEGCAKEMCVFSAHGTVHPQSPWMCFFFFLTSRNSRYFMLTFYTHVHFILIYMHIFKNFWKRKDWICIFWNFALHGAWSPKRPNWVPHFLLESPTLVTLSYHRKRSEVRRCFLFLHGVPP